MQLDPTGKVQLRSAVQLDPTGRVQLPEVCCAVGSNW